MLRLFLPFLRFILIFLLGYPLAVLWGLVIDYKEFSLFSREQLRRDWLYVRGGNCRTMKFL